jgi:hypothetical protein
MEQVEVCRCENCGREQAVPASWKLLPEANVTFLKAIGWRYITVQEPEDDLPYAEWYCPFCPVPWVIQRCSQ